MVNMLWILAGVFTIFAALIVAVFIAHVQVRSWNRGYDAAWDDAVVWGRLKQYSEQGEFS